MNLKAALALSLAILSLSAPALADEPSRRYGDIQPYASFPGTFPEGIVVEGARTYVSGPATFGTAGQGPSAIRVLDTTTGALVRTISLAGEDLSQEHALGCITSDGQGRLYALSTQLGVVRIDPHTGAQEVYASIPVLGACADLPPGPRVECHSGICRPPGGEACAPVMHNRGALPNDLAFDDAGNLYITDSFQATIFRVAPGGGWATPYYMDPRFDTSWFPGFTLGPNGIRVSPDRTKIAFTISMGPNAGVWTIPLHHQTPPQALSRRAFAYSNNEVPDGIAYGASGRLYVTLAGTNQIGVLDAWSRELVRVGSTAGVTPLDNPANVAFDGAGHLLVVNHAIFGNPADQGVLNMQVFDVASPLARPVVP